jgi:hypothetical protein
MLLRGVIWVLLVQFSDNMMYFLTHVCVGFFYFCDLENELQIVYIGFLKAFLDACGVREIPKN